MFDCLPHCLEEWRFRGAVRLQQSFDFCTKVRIGAAGGVEKRSPALVCQIGGTQKEALYFHPSIFRHGVICIHRSEARSMVARCSGSRTWKFDRIPRGAGWAAGFLAQAADFQQMSKYYDAQYRFYPIRFSPGEAACAGGMKDSATGPAISKL